MSTNLVLRRSLAVAAAVTVALAMGACGHESSTLLPGGSTGTAGAPSATSAASSAQTSAAPIDLPATAATVSQAPSSAPFTERAEMVATALREQSALTDWKTQLILLESATRAEGFDSEAAKLAWDGGLLKAGPALTDAAGSGPGSGSGTVTLADGSTIPVPLRSAVNAIASSSNAGGTSCEVIDLSPCPVIVERAELGTARFMTNRGPATLPVWSFWSAGATQAVTVVAVAGEALSPLPSPNIPAVDPNPFLPVLSLTRAQGNSLAFEFYHGACDGDLRAYVQEYDDVVIVGAQAMTQTAQACRDIALTATATVALRAPLGSRPVVSAADGRFASFGPWNF